MGVYEYITQFAGQPVALWERGAALTAGTIYRLSLDWNDSVDWGTLLQEFLAQPGASDVPGLIVGVWAEGLGAGMTPDPVVVALVNAAPRLPKVRALFLQDIIGEECEVSWLENTDISALFGAFPELTHFGVRGGHGLQLGALDLPELRHLVIQSSGLDSSVVREVMSARLPNLEHLELYLGDLGYGGDSTPEDITPLLDGTLFPRLKYLGLKNSHFQDELAQLLAQAPVLDGLETLDLSLGISTDETVRALLASEKVGRLKVLQLLGTSFSPELEQELLNRLEPLGVEVQLDEQASSVEEWRYVTLSE